MHRTRLAAVTAAIVGVAIVGITAFARGQQSVVDLADGDDVTVSCPTRMTFEFDDTGSAIVSCAGESTGPEQDDPSDSSEQSAPD